MAGSQANGISFMEYAPAEVPERLWQPLWQVHDRAFRQALADSRSTEEIDTYVGDAEHFKQVTTDPQMLVGNRHNPDQTYKRPTLIVAFDGDQPVGLSRLADNVSGVSEEIRQRKERFMPWKNYRADMEVAVDPRYQGLGIGLELGARGLLTASFLQRGTAYGWRELPQGTRLIKRMGGQPTGRPLPVKRYFGPDSDPVIQQRYVFRRLRTAHSTGKIIMRNL